MLAEPVLVGREKELEELMHCLDSAFNKKGTAVFISGEAGSGKTKLASEFLKIVHRKGATVLLGSCMSIAATPYLPFVEALKSYYMKVNNENVRSEGLEVTAWLTGLKQIEKPESFRNLTAQAWKDLTFEVVSKTLQSISTKKPTVLLIEDIHWADSASLALIHYLLRFVGSERILVLATFRSEELTTNIEGYGHPLSEGLRAMLREGLYKEIKLANLNQDDVTKVAENMVGGRVNSDLAQKLSEESRGNALFVVESLRMLSEHGSLYQKDDQWRLTVDTLGIPDKFRDVILHRLSKLKFSQRRVLDAASVIGEKFDVDLLSDVLNQDSLDVLENLNAIAYSTSLLHVEESFFSFDHAKCREAVYEEIALPLKRGYHKRVAEKLETTVNNGKVPLGEIAFHYAEAGIQDKAVKFASDAGQEALARFSNAEAIKHFIYVLKTVPDIPENAAVKSITLEGLGDAYYANCMFDEAIKTFESLANSGIGKLKIRALRKEMDAVFSKLVDAPHFLELVNKAEKYSGLDRLESARIRLYKGKALGHFFGKKNFALALKDAEEALEVFEEEYSLPDAAAALVEIGLESTLLSLQEKAFNASLRSIAIFEDIGNAREQAAALIRGVYTFLHDGLYQEALGIYNKVLQISQKIGDYTKMAEAASKSSRLLEIRGHYADALSNTLKAVEYSNKTDAKWLQAGIYADFVRQHVKLGDIARAEEYFRLLMKLPSEIRSAPPNALDYARAKAVFYAAKNQWGKSNHYFEKAFKIARSRNFLFGNIAVRVDSIWALNRHGHIEESKTLLGELQKIYDKVEERFSHVRIQASLMAPKKVIANEEFEMRLDLVNVSRKPGLLIKAEGIVVPEFKITSSPSNYTLKNGSIELKNRYIGPFQVETIKLEIKVSKTGIFTLSPYVSYVNELGELKTCKPNLIKITVKSAQLKYEVLPGRVPTGSEELDSLLFGGAPEKYAVVLASPLTDEREKLVMRFLEAGAQAGETTFRIATEAENAQTLTEKYPSNFYLFICNPQADATVQNHPNIFKLKGVENLTDIDIALTKAFRKLNPTDKSTKRICIEIISDALLQHHVVNTRRWLSALLPNLKSKGFTILAVVDPSMHPSEELQAVLSLFDGEIRVNERETAEGTKQVLKVKRLINQKYSDKEIVLNKETLTD